MDIYYQKKNKKKYNLTSVFQTNSVNDGLGIHFMKYNPYCVIT